MTNGSHTHIHIYKHVTGSLLHHVAAQGGKPSKDPRLAFVRPPKGPGALHEEIQVVLNLQQRIPAPAKYVVKSSVLMGDHTDVTVTKSISNPTEHQQNTTK